RTPPSARVFSTLDAGPVIIVTTPTANADAAERAAALEAVGARLLRAPAHDLRAALATLYRDASICSVLLEGGAALHAAAWNAGVVDRVRMYVTPDALGPTRVVWTMPESFDLSALHDARKEWLGRDQLMEGYVHGVD